MVHPLNIVWLWNGNSWIQKGADLDGSLAMERDRTLAKDG